MIVGVVSLIPTVDNFFAETLKPCCPFCTKMPENVRSVLLKKYSNMWDCCGSVANWNSIVTFDCMHENKDNKWALWSPGSWIPWAQRLLGTLVHSGLCTPRVPWAICTPSPLDPWSFWALGFLLLTPFQILNSNQSQCLKLGLLIIKLLKFTLHHVPQNSLGPQKTSH